MRARSIVVFTAGAAFAVALLARCGIAPATADGGTSASDGGSAASVCDCPAPPKPTILTAPCDGEIAEPQPNSGDSTLYATFHLDGYDPTSTAAQPALSALLCNETCPNNTCTCKLGQYQHCDGDSAGTPPTCVPGTIIGASSGEVLVACGQHHVNASFDLDETYKWSAVILRVQR